MNAPFSVGEQVVKTRGSHHVGFKGVVLAICRTRWDEQRGTVFVIKIGAPCGSPCFCTPHHQLDRVRDVEAGRSPRG